MSVQRYPVFARSCAVCHCASVNPAGLDKVPITVIPHASQIISTVSGIAYTCVSHDLPKCRVLDVVL